MPEDDARLEDVAGWLRKAALDYPGELSLIHI